MNFARPPAAADSGDTEIIVLISFGKVTAWDVVSVPSFTPAPLKIFELASHQVHPVADAT